MLIPSINSNIFVDMIRVGFVVIDKIYYEPQPIEIKNNNIGKTINVFA